MGKAQLSSEYILYIRGDNARVFECLLKPLNHSASILLSTHYAQDNFLSVGKNIVDTKINKTY